SNAFFLNLSLCVHGSDSTLKLYHGPVHVFAMSMTRVFWHFPTFLMTLILSERVPRPTAIFQCFFSQLITLCERFRFNQLYHGPVHVFAMSMTRVFWHFPTFLMPLILSERVPRPTAIFQCLVSQLISLCARFRFNLDPFYQGPVHVFAMSMTRVFWHFPTFLMPLILSERVPR